MSSQLSVYVTNCYTSYKSVLIWQACIRLLTQISIHPHKWVIFWESYQCQKQQPISFVKKFCVNLCVAWFDMYYSLHIYLKLNFDCSTHSNIVLAVAMINKICKTEIIILFWGSFWRLQTNNVVVNDYLVRATVVTSFVCRNIIDFDFLISDAEIDMRHSNNRMVDRFPITL
jgi:hypothetical protein